jgi:hypothetical protein
MTAKEALYIISLQIQDNDINLEALDILESVVNILEPKEYELYNLFGDIEKDLNKLTLSIKKDK